MFPMSILDIKHSEKDDPSLEDQNLLLRITVRKRWSCKCSSVFGWGKATAGWVEVPVQRPFPHEAHLQPLSLVLCPWGLASFFQTPLWDNRIYNTLYLYKSLFSFSNFSFISLWRNAIDWLIYSNQIEALLISAELKPNSLFDLRISMGNFAK